MNRLNMISIFVAEQNTLSRDFFIKNLSTPEVLWAIRIIAIAIVILIFILYRKTK